MISRIKSRAPISDPSRTSPSTLPQVSTVLHQSVTSLSRHLRYHEGDIHYPSHHLGCCKRRAGSERGPAASADLRFASTHSPVKITNPDITHIGWNYSPISKDNEAISLAYQDVDVDLFFPAFLRPETIPTETFANGTSGPTNETTLGMPDFYGY